MTSCPPRSHLHIELRRRDSHTAANQCLDCNRAASKSVPISGLPREVALKLKPWKRPEPKKQPGRIKKQHHAFYKTKAWEAQQLRVLIRDNYECRCCGEYANTGHHIPPYHEPIEETPDDRVIAACPICQLAEKAARTTRNVLGLPLVPVKSKGRG